MSDERYKREPVMSLLLAFVMGRPVRSIINLPISKSQHEAARECRLTQSLELSISILSFCLCSQPFLTVSIDRFIFLLRLNDITPNPSSHSWSSRSHGASAVYGLVSLLLHTSSALSDPNRYISSWQTQAKLWRLRTSSYLSTVHIDCSQFVPPSDTRQHGSGQENGPELTCRDSAKRKG